MKMITVNLWGCYLSELCSWTTEVANCSPGTFVWRYHMGDSSWGNPRSTSQATPKALALPSPSETQGSISGILPYKCYVIWNLLLSPFLTVAFACVEDINCKEKGNEVQLTRLSTVCRYCFFLTMFCNYFSCSYHNTKKLYRTLFKKSTC